MISFNMLKQAPKVSIVDLYGDDDLDSFVSIKCMNEPTFVYQQTSYTSKTKISFFHRLS